MSKIVYEKIGVTLRNNDSRDGAMTAEDAKEYLGWEEEDGDKNFADNFVLRDINGKKVRLNNVPNNRSFRMVLAKRYANEMVRKKWRLNGETIIIDRLGHVCGGQHRLVGLVLAEQMRQKEASRYREHFGWRTGITAEMLIVTGISEKRETADTTDLGQGQSFADKIHRHKEFKSASRKDQPKLARIKAIATRLVWLRIGGKTVSDAPHFPHSEALEFMEAHPRIHEAVEFVFNEDGGSERKISTFISLGYAAALLYLMGAVKTDPMKWMDKGLEALNFKGWDKAEEFWTLLASGAGLPDGSPILLCSKALSRMKAGGSDDRDEKIGVVVKAFNLWIDGQTAAPGDIKVKKGKDADTGKVKLMETPRLGGIDIEREPEEEPAQEEESQGHAEGNGKPKKGRGKKAFDWTGEWAWVAAETPWKGKVKAVDGDEATVTAEEDGKDYMVAVGDLRSDKPE